MRAIKIIAAVAAVVGAETRVVTATGSAFAYFEGARRRRRRGRASGAFGMVAVPKCFPACVEGFGGATEGSSGRVEGEG